MGADPAKGRLKKTPGDVSFGTLKLIPPSVLGLEYMASFPLSYT